jgi:PAS domain S-box-containing protein
MIIMIHHRHHYHFNQQKQPPHNQLEDLAATIATEVAAAPAALFWGNLIIETIEKVFFSLDTEWHFTFVNNWAAKILGRSKESLLGKILWQEFPNLLGTSLEQFYRQAMASDKPEQLEDFSPSSSSITQVTQTWYDIRTYPLPKQGLIVNFQDITARKQAELALQESEARFKALSESTFEGVVLSHQGIIVAANQRAAQMLGYSDSADLIGLNGAQFAAPETLTERPQPTASDETIYELALVSKGPQQPQHIFPAEVRGKIIEYGGQTVVVAAMRDITERKRIEQQLKDSEERYKTLSEASQEGLVLHENGVIIEANQRLAHMFGYSLTELIGMSLSQLVIPEEVPFLQARLTTTAATTKNANIEATNPAMQTNESIGLRRDGTTFFMEVTGREIEYRGKRVRLMAVRDISQLKTAEDTLQKTQAQLLQSQKLESIGRLAGGVAHDFNNILTIINSCGELVLDEISELGLEENSDLTSDATEIVKAAQRAAALTNQLLAFSRQQMLQPRLFNLNDSVTAMDKMLQRLLGEDIQLHSIFDPTLGEVEADPNQLEQVIVNLAVNARDAMPNGGKLTIETANVELDESYHSAGHPEVKTGAYVMLAISDNGSGMDRATQDKIFEPFFTTKEPGKGTGLGLATVYGIVRQSGGYIWVYSEVGVGTTFKIYLPRVKPKKSLKVIYPQASHPLQTTTFEGSGSSAGINNNREDNEVEVATVVASPSISTDVDYTVLVVEDDTLISELIQRVLKGTGGYTTLQAMNGREALNLLRGYTGPLDLVLTDIVMPEMGGRELVQQLKTRWPQLKVMCMSGYTDQAVLRHGILEQCDHFLQKPFTPSMLLERIGVLLEARSSGNNR